MLPFVCLCTWLAIFGRTGGAQDVASDDDACLAQINIATLSKQVSGLSADDDPKEEPDVNPDHSDDFEPPEHGYATKGEHSTDKVGPSLFQEGTNCNDNPSGWYDADGHKYHCGWYGQGDRCQMHGHGFARLGKTANDACCVCGGGGAAHAPGQIKSRKNGQCLDMHTNPHFGRNVYMHPCHGGDNQLWYFEDGQLKNLRSGRRYCLDQNLGGSANLYMHRCHDGYNQKFSHAGDAIFRANRDPHSSEKAAVDVHPHANNVYIHPWHGLANQQWDIGGALTVKGRWVPLHTVQKTTELAIKHGTTKTSSVTRSEQWSQAVSATVSAGGTVFGVGLSAEVSTEIGHSAEASHRQEFVVSEETGLKFGFEFIRGEQQFLWQWQYNIDTQGAESVTTKTRDYSVTAGRHEPPKCVPGYCRYVPRCQECVAPGIL